MQKDRLNRPQRPFSTAYPNRLLGSTSVGSSGLWDENKITWLFRFNIPTQFHLVDVVSVCLIHMIVKMLYLAKTMADRKRRIVADYLFLGILNRTRQRDRKDSLLLSHVITPMSVSSLQGNSLITLNFYSRLSREFQ